MNPDVRTAIFGHKVCGTLVHVDKYAENINKSKRDFITLKIHRPPRHKSTGEKLNFQIIRMYLKSSSLEKTIFSKKPFQTNISKPVLENTKVEMNIVCNYMFS